MNLNYIYNFRNPVRYFISIDHLDYPTDIQSFDPIDNLCWTKPMPFRVYKSDDRFRIVKMPNILNFVRAYNYYKILPHFADVKNLDFQHKRLEANLDTGDFVSGNYNLQLNDDFSNLCNYDYLVKLDISEYYGRIYTHYLDLSHQGLKDEPIAWMNNGRTSGILMGNYLSLYFAEYMSSRISEQLQLSLNAEGIDCVYNYFSDDFYFFCNEMDVDIILSIFDKVLGEFDFTRKEKKEIWSYESYNDYNLLTRYWKATIRTWNLEILKDYEAMNKHPENSVKHKYTFLNQLVYRLSGLKDEKSKRGLITNFFKTNHFQTCDYSNYEVRSYDLHQLLFLVKSAPESLLYISHIINEIEDIKNDPRTESFLKARYKEALKHELQDVQLYFYYALKLLGFDDAIKEMKALIIESQNQVLISYYLKDGYFDSAQVDVLKLIDGEDYWFQNYHLILYTDSLKNDLDNSVKKYLVPKRIYAKPNSVKEARYKDFYKTNIQNGHSLINEISDITTAITDYLKLRYKETAEVFEDDN
jgi:hypothetical protein